MSDFETVPVGTMKELEKVKEERDMLVEQVAYWRERAVGAEAERDALAAHVENWKEAAAQYARNADFYQGIVRQIGEMFGEEARTSDDGSVQDDVLALKVPELVEALVAHVEACREVFENLSEYWNGGEGMAAEDAARHAMDASCDMLEVLPTTSLTRLKAEWQADQTEQIREMCEGLTGSQIRSALDGLLAGLHRQAEGDNLTLLVFK